MGVTGPQLIFETMGAGIVRVTQVIRHLTVNRVGSLNPEPDLWYRLGYLGNLKWTVSRS